MIATIAAGEFLVNEILLRQPKEGLWRARVKIASPDVVEGESFVLTDGTNEWHGVARSIVNEGPLTAVDLVGGAGSLDSLTIERYYTGGVDFGSVLSDLCADVGESPDTAITGQLGTWRTRGDSLRGELTRLARFTTGAFRITPAGLVSLSVASGDTDPPGRFIREDNGSRTYETSSIAPLAGLTVDGWEVGVLLYHRSEASPLSASLWRAEPARVPNPPRVVEGRVTADLGGRVDVITSTGVLLSDVPLFSVVGYVPEVVSGSRVLVLDLGDDPRGTIALVGAADATATEIEIKAATTTITANAVGVEVTSLLGPVAFPLVRTGDNVTLTFAAPVVPGTPVLALVGPSISSANGQPSSLKSS